MIFCFAHSEQEFIAIYVNGKEIEHVKERKNGFHAK